MRHKENANQTQRLQTLVQEIAPKTQPAHNAGVQSHKLHKITPLLPHSQSPCKSLASPYLS